MTIAVTEVGARYLDLLAEVTAACRRAARDSDDVAVVAVSKVQPVSAIEAAMKAGCIDFGENRIDELRDKQPRLPSGLRWHFIGHLQRNKVKYLSDAVALVHGVDSEKLVEAFERRSKTPRKVLIQVNVGDEQQKSGASEAQALALAMRCSGSPTVRAVGLMCIPPFSADPEEARPFYTRLATLRAEIQDELGSVAQDAAEDFTHLSMGMTSDFPVAIEEGATLIRVGTRIFGPRPSKKELG